MQCDPQDYSTKTPSNFVSLTNFFLIPALFIVLAYFSYQLSLKVKDHGYWIPFFLFGIAVPSLWLLETRFLATPRLQAKLQKYLKAAYLLALIILYEVAKTAIVNAFQAEATLLTPALLIALLIINILIASVAVAYSKPLVGSSKFKLGIIGITSFLLSLVAWCALFELVNWKFLVQFVEAHAIYSSMAFILLLFITITYLFPTLIQSNNLYQGFKQKVDVVLNAKVLLYLFYVVAISSFILLAFRYDMLYIGSATFHWEYFVGPIRTVKSGGWLLWDAPTQYGFFNIFLASLIPVKSSWQALYIFQSVLLAIAATLAFWTIIDNKSHSSRRVIFSFLIISCALFFADPALIGPTPYPSSSVVRFFWCYVLLFYIFFTAKFPTLSLKSFTCWGSILWVFAALWSAESMIYSSFTFFAALATKIWQNYKQREGTETLNTNQLLKYFLYKLSIPFYFLLAALALITIYYQIYLGHFPDWQMFYQFALIYADGFAAQDLHPVGSVWLVLLLFIGIVTATTALVAKTPADKKLPLFIGTLGGLWAVTSYFIGRAVPQNITAMFPIYALIACLVTNELNKQKACMTSLPLKLAVIPLLMIILLNCFANGLFITNIKKIRAFSPDVSQQFILIQHKDAGYIDGVSDPALLALLQAAKVSAQDPIAFYGPDAAPPVWKSHGKIITTERTWLPNPLYMLDIPGLPKQKIKGYIDRYLQHSGCDGYLVQAKNPALQAAPDGQLPAWLEPSVERYCQKIISYENASWKVVKYESRV